MAISFIIAALHLVINNPICRVRQLKAAISPEITKVTLPHYTTIQSLFDSIKKDLDGINAWRYQRQISGGIQEYMEAISFQHYLETQDLISHQQAQTKLPEGIQLTEDDYVLGLFDLVGELMRFAITSMATNGRLPGRDHRSSDTADNMEGLIENRRDIATDLRSLRSCFEAMDTKGSILGRDTEKKMEVMQTCVEKVENAVYGMIVRGRERPMGWVPDLRDEAKAEPVESY